MLVLHLSDLHLSRYGESGTWTQRDEDTEEDWRPMHIWEGWQIEAVLDRKGRVDKLRLVDPEGVVHREKGSSPRKEEKVLAELLATAQERHRTSADNLIRNRPTPEDLEYMLQADPRNTNLRFLRIIERINELGPDIVLVTGDCTDHGFGYNMVLHYFAPWIDRHRFFVVPGNHDTYDMLPRRGRKARAQFMENTYQEFAAAVGLEQNHVGTYVRRVEDVAIVGLNSCKMPLTFLSASGEVPIEQLIWLRELGRDSAFANTRIRIAMVHHHLLGMPFTVGSRTPIEMGMRLRNATEVMEVAAQAKINILFNGHRHHGYMVQLPGHPMVIAAPSATLGCKSVGRVYGWLLDFQDKHPYPIMYELYKD